MWGTYNSELWELLGLELNMPANGKVAYFSEWPGHYQAIPISLFPVSKMSHRQGQLLLSGTSLPPES